MRILLFGNPSTLHSNLAKGLRERGHEVRCISNRTGWRMFPVDDILLERRRDINGKLALLDYLCKALPVLWKCRGYDIVQLHNPMMLELRGNHIRPFYDFIRRNNRKLVLSASGDDYHIVERMLNGNKLRYSDQRIGDRIRTDATAVEQRHLWIDDYRKEAGISRYIARDCDAIISCLYEYHACYEDVYPRKLLFIPLPMLDVEGPKDFCVGEKVKILIGIQKERTELKGTDIMLRAAQMVAKNLPDRCELTVVENIPYNEYKELLKEYDVLLDQLYSYTPAMNALLAMANGVVVVGGGEPENYEIIGEDRLRPIVNVQPTYDSVYEELRELVIHKERIPQMKREAVEYVHQHHDYRKVAQMYEEVYLRLMRE